MAALIRSALIGAARRRLGAAGDASPLSHASDNEADQAAAALQTLREEMEVELRRQLSAELDESYRRERERGRQDGYAAGLEEARSRVAAELSAQRSESKEQIASTLSSLRQAHESTLTQLESHVGEIAFAAVCRLVGEQMQSPDFLLQLVRQVCSQVRADTAATLKLHPRDIAALADLLGEPPRVAGLGVQLVADESLQLGGCLIEAESGHFDGGLEQQLRRLHALLSLKS